MAYIRLFLALALAVLQLCSFSNAFERCDTHLVREDVASIILTSVEVSPELPLTGKSVSLSFIGQALATTPSLTVHYVISVLGITVHSESVNICSLDSVRCPIQADDRFEGKVHYHIPESLPENLPVHVTFYFHTFSPSTADACYVESFTPLSTPSSGSLTSRFGFDEAEVTFLFNSWYTQHKDILHMPKQESHSGFLSGQTSRRRVFHDNLLKVALHNSKEDSSYKMALNQFAHLTSSEFKQLFASGYKPKSTSLRTSSSAFSSTSVSKTSSSMMVSDLLFFSLFRSLSSSSVEVALPESVNWVKAGGVTEVKNQGSCGSCWSFATTGAVEGAYFVKHHKLVSLSEQELVSCDHEDLGCNGGSMDQAFSWIKQNAGLCLETAYPYTAGTGTRGFCEKDTCETVKGTKVESWVDVTHSELSLEEAVAKSPVAVAIEADESAFQFYSSGVLDQVCSNKLDHGVLLVGYGVEPATEESGETDKQSGEKFWLIKNSWGPEWGLKGYVKILRSDNKEYEGGECGVLLSPSYPVLE